MTREPNGLQESNTSDRVDVALPLPIPRAFTYAVPGGLSTSVLSAGTRVLVPFRRDERIGWVVGPARGPTTSRLRPVLDVLDHEPSVTDDVLQLCRWMSEYYCAPLGVALKAALPAVLSDASRDYLSLADSASLPPPDVGKNRVRPRERRLFEALARATGPRSVRALRRELGMRSIWPEVRSLVARGLLCHKTMPPDPPRTLTRRVVRVARWLADLSERERIFGHAQRQREVYEWLEVVGGSAELAVLRERVGCSRSVITQMERKGVVAVVDEEVARDPFRDRGGHRELASGSEHDPTAAQASALDTLLSALAERRPRPVLLHGVTGSGKTLVYIELLGRVLASGRTAIVLVPEISLTPQTVARFRARFGDRVAVLHSGLSDGERYDQWRSLRAGDKHIAVGARSAVFAPLPCLGAIVVDEEHEGSYKQSESPRYHARDLAVVRAAMSGAVCVLGSATPALETWTNVDRGKFTIAALPERAGAARLPQVRVVDLREQRPGMVAREWPGAKRGGAVILTVPLVDAIQERLCRGEQVMLLLNRRGYASFVQCRDCGDVPRCPRCSVSLTFHRVSDRLLCHHCRYEERAPRHCARCVSHDLSFRGLGTQQVERVVAETFPGARLARMDADTTPGKWAHHEIIGRVERGEVDILMGTQMIAKGLDFPRVTLVGVINADVGIHLPDFRASERTFQLLSQAAGRAGRGELPGEVIVQTSLPEHYAITAALEHDYDGFARRELAERRHPAYPPWVRLANVVVSSADAAAAAAAAEKAAAWLIGLPGTSSVELVGPAPAPIECLHGRWRWHFLLRARSTRALTSTCHALIEGFTPSGGDVRVALDRDPVALL